MEIGLPRLAYRPTAVMALQIEQLLRFLGFLTIAVCHDLARTNLALPSRAARNRRSGLSSHPPSRGDLLGASVKCRVLTTVGPKLSPTVRSGLFVEAAWGSR